MICFPIILISSHICLLNEWYRPLNFFVVFLLSVIYIYIYIYVLCATFYMPVFPPPIGVANRMKKNSEGFPMWWKGE